MKHREDEEFIDPEDRRPAQVNIAFKIGGHDIYFLIIVRTYIKLEIRSSDDRWLRKKNGHLCLFYHCSIGIIGYGGNLATGEGRICNDGCKEKFLLNGDPFQRL